MRNGDVVLYQPWINGNGTLIKAAEAVLNGTVTDITIVGSPGVGTVHMLRQQITSHIYITGKITIRALGRWMFQCQDNNLILIYDYDQHDAHSSGAAIDRLLQGFVATGGVLVRVKHG